MGLLLSALLIRDTIHYSQEEATQNPEWIGPRSFWGSFGASLRDRTLLSCNQAGLVTKINDAAVWGLFPLFLASQGLDVVRIGLVAAIYPQVWGVTQLGTGFLSDHVGTPRRAGHRRWEVRELRVSRGPPMRARAPALAGRGALADSVRPGRPITFNPGSGAGQLRQSGGSEIHQ